jgi:hypothetical protein
MKQSLLSKIPFKASNSTSLRSRRVRPAPISLPKMLVLYSCSQFHHYLTCSFYKRRSWKCKKDWQLDCIFFAFGICRLKGFALNIGEIDPSVQFHLRFTSTNAPIFLPKNTIYKIGAHKMLMILTPGRSLLPTMA